MVFSKAGSGFWSGTTTGRDSESSSLSQCDKRPPYFVDSKERKKDANTSYFEIQVKQNILVLYENHFIHEEY